LYKSPIACRQSGHPQKSLVDQLETHLKPVLRGLDYAAFDIDRAFAEVERLATLIRGD
jgi:hypothetical protein